MSNFVYLIIEFLDELVFGVKDAAWPFIQTELQLNYTQIGILLTMPSVFSTIVEPFLGIMGDFLLIPLLEKVDGLRYLRLSVLTELPLFPAFLLTPLAWGKLVLVGLLGLFYSGWYAILKGRLYSSLKGRSGTVMALENITGLAGGLLPLGIGLAADAFGLSTAIWLLLAGPIALLIGLPRRIISPQPFGNGEDEGR